MSPKVIINQMIHDSFVFTRDSVVVSLEGVEEDEHRQRPEQDDMHQSARCSDPTSPGLGKSALE